MDADVAPQGDSLRADIDAAMAQVEAGTDTATPTPAPEPKADATPPPEPGEGATGERIRDASGRFARHDKAAEPAATPTQQPAQATPTATPAPTQAQATATEQLRAPQAWKASEREKWGQTPPEVQSAVMRREHEVKAALQESADARRFRDGFQQAVGPFEGLIRARGLEPLSFVASMAQTWAALQTGPETSRAQVLASIIKGSGVPIPLLDKALVGEAPGPGEAGAGQYRDPRVDQLMAQLQQAAQQRQATISQKSASEVQSFGQGKEFFEDVREDMADMLELAAKRGVEMTLEQAYSRAVAMHPDISEVLKQREAAKHAQNASASTARAKAAASSVRSQPAGASRAPQQKLNPLDDMKADIEAAMAELDGR